MSYTVTWSPTAEARLAELWLDPAHRSALADATAALDDRLRQHGPEVGESRDEGRRIAFEPPFAVIFRCDTAARHVTVLYIWAY